MLHISANQWRTSILKACLGAYVKRGVAEDVADASLTLLSMGKNPLPSLLPLVEAFDPDTSPANWVGDEAGYAASNARVLIDGPSIVDLAEAGKEVKCRVDDGLFLSALVTARMHANNVHFELTLDVQRVEDLSKVESGPADVSIALSIGSPKPPTALCAFPVPHEGDWVKLQELANQILVPADDLNRADAGAGLTDND